MVWKWFKDGYLTIWMGSDSSERAKTVGSERNEGAAKKTTLSGGAIHGSTGGASGKTKNDRVRRG